MNIPTKIEDELAAAMEQWTDKRVIDDDDLEDLLLFVVYGPSVLSQSGYHLGGYTCRQKNDQWLLTVKVTESSIPLVVFITGQTPTACIRQFWRLWENDRLKWSKDRYPWN